MNLHGQYHMMSATVLLVPFMPLTQTMKLCCILHKLGILQMHQIITYYHYILERQCNIKLSLKIGPFALSLR